MQPREWRNIDKTGWPPGPWVDEPDGRLWQDQASGLPCAVLRHPHGFLAGVVGLKPQHRWYPAARTAHRVEPSPIDYEVISLGVRPIFGGAPVPPGHRWIGFGCEPPRGFAPAPHPRTGETAGDPASYVDFAAAIALTERLAAAVAAEMADAV